MRVLCNGLLIFAVVPITACATFDGAPRPVVTHSQMASAISLISPNQALRNFHGDEDDRTGMSRRDYRDYIAGIYLMAADAEYRQYRTALAAGERNSAVGFDLASLLLTSGASVANPGTARNLATAATAMTGVRTSFDRNLFFNRTIPAIITAMDAERTRARAQIAERLRQDDRAYPLVQFFSDLQGYELAATMERAIGVVSEQANEDLAAANVRLSRALRACVIDDDGDAAMERLEPYFTSADARANLETAADELGITVPEGMSDVDLENAIGERLETQNCEAGSRATAVNAIIERIGSGE
jgi:hypothetical protein